MAKPDYAHKLTDAQLAKLEQRIAKKYEHRNMAESVAIPSKSDAAAPVLRETVNTIVNGQVVKVYKDEIEKTLYKHYNNAMIMKGVCEWIFLKPLKK